MAQGTPPKAESAPPKTPTNDSASKPLKPGDPGFVNPYANYVADLDPSGTMDDGRSYVGRMSHYVDKSPPKATRGSANRSQSFRQPQGRVPQPMPNPRPSGRNPTPQTNGKPSRYSTAQSGREYQQSRWSGQPLATSSKLPEGFFGTAKGTTSMPAPPTAASITSTSKKTRRGNRGDGCLRSQEGEGWGETRSRDSWEESQQRTQKAWKPRHEPIPTAESADTFFGTPKDVSSKAPTPEAHPSSRARKTDDLPQMQWGTPQVNRAESDRNGHESVDQTRDHLGTSGWFTNPAFDRKDRPAQQPQPQPQPQPQAPPMSGGVRFGEREAVKEQGRPPGQQPARPPEPRRSEEATKPRDIASVPPRPVSQEGDPLLIQYPVGDGCWVKMVVYVERDSKTAYSRLSGIGRRQISGVKVKTPEQLGDMVKDIVVDEKKSLLG
ncbi:hypothetical protein BGZ74_006565 [Mortierella antarctica]|nr:hypothetical protein BGZ74_006565 [Mortierella antarctica]